ncbi:lymphocyte antigen 6E-like [Pelodiscus sinensis]|uniref:lymphocyte antigen 6E-like n=1 Tax=Pelodiscus sinensis TaxID=13735 RepID=UPI003F6B1512
MKAFLFTLLAVALGMEQVASLSCFTCSEESSNLKCLTPTQCGDSDKYCLTIYATGGIGDNKGQRISKKCSSVCPQTNLNIGIAALSTSCCETFLCNFSGASSVRASYAVMVTGILASLLCVLRTGL